jgi:hypothetical protein
MPRNVLRFSDPDLHTEEVTVRFQPSGKVIVKLAKGTHYTFHPGMFSGIADVHKSDEDFPEGDPRRYQTLLTFDKDSIVREIGAIGPDPIIEFAKLWCPLRLDWMVQRGLLIGPRLPDSQLDGFAGISVKRGPSDETLPECMKPPEFYGDVLQRPGAAYLLFDSTEPSSEPYGVMISCRGRDGHPQMFWVTHRDLQMWVAKWEPVFIAAWDRISGGNKESNAVDSDYTTLDGGEKVSKPQPAIPFKRGDFVGLRRGVAGSVGVVWDIHPDSLRSVEVYWRESETSRISQAYEPKDLNLVPLSQVPQYAMELKSSLGL